MRKTMLKYLFTGALLLTGLMGRTQTSFGPVTSWKPTASGLEAKVPQGLARVWVYNPNTIRISLTQKKQFRQFSYMLTDTAAPSFKGFRITEQADSIIIKTSELTATITRKPFWAVRVTNASGQLISEDYAGSGFGAACIGERINWYRKLQSDERFVGLGEVLGPLDKRGSGYTLNNTDTYKYGDPRLPVYTNVPFFIGMHHQLVYGLFFHNSYKSFFNFGLSTPEYSSITADGGDIDYFLISAPSISDILEHYSSLTGRIPLPPKWAIGYHQSRCSYFPQDRVLQIAESFRRKNIPADGIVLDADYLVEYEPFRIHPQRFPDMKGMNEQLRKLHFEVTASVNPGIKIDSSYIAWNDGLKANVYIRYSNGQLYQADIWPNRNHYVDYTNPRGRAWWSKQMNMLPQYGIHGFWNDMNEPAVGGSYIPDNLAFHFDGHGSNSLEAKNLFGMLMARSSYEAARIYTSDRRPFVLTRSGFAGVQRYAAVWSGDNTAKDEYLLGGQLLNTQMGLSGIPFTGDDIGGYIGATSRELFARWIAIGSLQPYARNHKEAYAAANEPWSYGEESEAIAKSYIGFRYKLLPYFYSLFYEASAKGMPISRSLSMYWPFKNPVFDPLYQYQSLLGPSLLLVPVTPSEKIKKLYLPPGTWYDLHTDAALSGDREISIEAPLHQLPMYVKASAIIPMQPEVQWSGEQPKDTLYLHVYSGNEKNEFIWYEDAGDGYAYQKNEFAKRRIEYLPAEKTIRLNAQTGDYHPSYRIIKLVLHGFPTIGTVRINQTEMPVLTTHEKLINPLQELALIYDPMYTAQLRSREEMQQQYYITVPFTGNELSIEWR